MTVSFTFDLTAHRNPLLLTPPDQNFQGDFDAVGIFAASHAAKSATLREARR
jgi:hypothetical protein